MERAKQVSPQIAWAFGLTVVLGLLASAAGAAISIEMVTVGDAGNVGELSGRADLGTERLCGAVPYIYQIGKYEVTNAQYRAFLNSAARYGDPYKLYGGQEFLYQDLGGIQRTGGGMLGDPYVYVPMNNDPNWETRPVNYVSWYSSLRFINWVQNGQPVAQAGPGVTETGTYTFSEPNVVIIGPPGEEVTIVLYDVTIPDHVSLPPSTWVLPTEDEWYKAAYYKSGGTAAGYWDYATQSDELPNNYPPGLDTGNSANYTLIDGDPNTPGTYVGPPYNSTEVGAYALSVSAYGTYDQNGNVSEWNEGQPEEPYRGVRGSSWGYYQYGLPAFWRYAGASPEIATPDVGFRIGLVPEPCTGGMLSLAALLFLSRRSVKRG